MLVAVIYTGQTRTIKDIIKYIKYDYVIRLRTDVVITKKIDFS